MNENNGELTMNENNATTSGWGWTLTVPAGTADATGNWFSVPLYPLPQQPTPLKSSSCPYCTPRCPHGFIADPVRPYITWGGYQANGSGTTITFTNGDQS
jgi:hypothetical protein